MKFPFLDFQTVEQVPDELFERYRGRVEDSIIELWQTTVLARHSKAF